ncbi:hypothetical protein C0585_08065 [Candidatus Woesearchaeota archaeon]|nr:MAG: hypothetical protein C0585_08065 [Candidatus Woesearchaeota archaeon]
MEDRWYEQYDFDDNPFLIDPISDEPRQLIGREEEEKEIIYRILSSNMIFIESAKGRGKTSLLRHAIENFRGHGKVIYVDANKVQKTINVELLLKGAAKVRSGIMGKKPKNLILLLDNIESMTQRNWERIKYYFDQNYLKSVVFTGKNYSKVKFPESIKSRIGNRVIKLPNLESDEALQIIQDRLGDDYEEILSDEEIMQLYKISKGDLKNFITNNYRLAQYKYDAGKSEIMDLDEIKTATRMDVTEVYEVDDEDEIEANLCEECESKLVKIGQYYRCKDCDNFCTNCGALIAEDDKKCPECNVEFED